MKQVEVHKEELDWLRDRLSSRYASTTRTELTPNSHLGNYDLLARVMSGTLDEQQDEYVSTNLLRKLFYYSVDKKSVVFRIGFVDACYRFISKGRFNREMYIEQLAIHPQIDASASHPWLNSNGGDDESSPSQRFLSRTYRFVGYGALFFVTVTAILIASGLIDMRTLPWVLSKGPHHTRWVCEYERRHKGVQSLSKLPDLRRSASLLHVGLSHKQN